MKLDATIKELEYNLRRLAPFADIGEAGYTEGFYRSVAFAVNVLNGKSDRQKVPPGMGNDGIILKYEPVE